MLLDPVSSDLQNYLNQYNQPDNLKHLDQGYLNQCGDQVTKRKAVETRFVSWQRQLFFSLNVRDLLWSPSYVLCNACPQLLPGSESTGAGS